ncbi:hypothetical protein KUCAC02_036138, partial [Chaenocephalus aceratus]
GKGHGRSSSASTGTSRRRKLSARPGPGGKLQYQGTPIAIYEDYTPEVMEQCYKYREVMAELSTLGLQASPAVPCEAFPFVSKEEVRKRFSSVAEAKGYIASIRPTLTSTNVPITIASDGTFIRDY